MNDLVNIDFNLTMSSLEIAELTGKEHKNVTRDIRVMFDALGTELSFALSEQYGNSQQFGFSRQYGDSQQCGDDD